MNGSCFYKVYILTTEIKKIHFKIEIPHRNLKIILFSENFSEILCFLCSHQCGLYTNSPIGHNIVQHNIEWQKFRNLSSKFNLYYIMQSLYNHII